MPLVMSTVFMGGISARWPVVFRRAMDPDGVGWFMRITRCQPESSFRDRDSVEDVLVCRGWFPGSWVEECLDFRDGGWRVLVEVVLALVAHGLDERSLEPAGVCVLLRCVGRLVLWLGCC